jgi:hypothetical protein
MKYKHPYPSAYLLSSENLLSLYTHLYSFESLLENLFTEKQLIYFKAVSNKPVLVVHISTDIVQLKATSYSNL